MVGTWTIGARIRGGYALLIALLAVVAGVSAYALITTRDRFNESVEIQRDDAQRALVSAKAFADASRDFRAFLLTSDESQLRAQDAQIRAARAGFTALRDRSRGTERGARWSHVVDLTSRWDAAAQRAVAAARRGRHATALRIFRDETLPPASEQEGLVQDLVANARDRAAVAAHDASHRADVSLWIALGAALVALAAGILLAARLSRSVTTRLREAIGTLASASAEILAATRQQAASALEEESAVQETSSTVEEVKQTVELSTEKAGGVADAIVRTAEVSQEGRRAVDETIRGTLEAKSRMEAIAERILALSEQAATIEEITATVNDLADQSSLLAVNASIEAAKAGEAGRGFAVVAAEVKALAAQSKQAAAEIRRNLGEIRDATQAAVLATEQGVHVSESGETLAAQAGEAIHELASKLEDSAQASQQILVSSRQQMTGMDQVALAMENIRQTATQNMAATRQVDQAAQDLNELAQGLRALVGAGDRRRGLRAA